MSNAISATYGVPCPKCGAARQEACRTMNGLGRVTDTHKSRIDLALRKRQERLAALRAAANGTLTPDRRPYVPPEPETPAERVQGEAGEGAK